MLDFLYFPLFLKVSILLPITCIIAGGVGASAFIGTKMPSLKSILQKLEPYQVAIGAAALLIGVFKLIDYPSALGFLGNIGYLAACIACIVLGLVLGFPALKRLFINDMSEENRNKAEKLRETLAPYQILSGVVAIILGVYLFFK